jgi:hypothetical protein
MTAPHMTDAEAAAYARGRQDEADECAQRHLVVIGDVLDAIERHVGDPERLRQHILTALRCDAS